MPFRVAFALVLSLLLVFSVATPVAAAEFRSGDNTSVAAGETVDDDVYLAGGTVTIAGTVTRDALVATEDLDVTGQIDGNLIAAGNEIDIRGSVGRTIRAAGNEIRVFGTVGGDVVAAGATVTIEPGASVAGDVIVGAGDAEILGEVRGDVRAGGGLLIDAPVGGEVRVSSDDIRLGPNARVTGALYYDSDEAPEIADGAVVSGPVEERELDDDDGMDFGFGGFLFDLARLLAALVAGAVVVLLLPRRAVAVADAVRERPFPALLWGLGLLVLVPIVLIILMVTVIGIPIALIGLASYLAALYLSQVFVGLALGRLAINRSRFGGDAGRGINLLAMALGVIVLTLVRLIPIVDVAVAIVTALLGLGALALAVRRRRGESFPASGSRAVPAT